MPLIGALRRILARVTHEEGGQVLVIAVGALFAITALASYGIDTAIWHVHGRHLQTQADAAALAGARELAKSYVNGSCSDTAVTNVVKQYDGTLQSTNTPQYNQQVPSPTSLTYSTSYSATQHNLFDRINQPSFINQSFPNDSGLTGSPCADAAVDTKLTETNLPSYIPFVSPGYINRQARVELKKIASTTATLPLAIPAASPGSVSVELVDETNGSIVGTSTALNGSSDGTAWTGSVPLNLSGTTNTTFPMGVLVATSGGTTASFSNCGTGSGASAVFCYGSGSNNGVFTTRVWTRGASTTVQAGDVWFAKVQGASSAASDCSSGAAGAISNLFSSSSSTKVTMCANMFFPTTAGKTLACSGSGSALNVSVNVKDSSNNTTALNCPASTDPNVGTWWAGLTVPATGTLWGPRTYEFDWTVTTGTKPSNASGGDDPCGNSGNKQCVGVLSNVQRVFAAAYDSVSETNSSNQGGPITSATVTYNNGVTTSAPLETTSASSAPSTVTVTLGMIGFATSQEIPSTPTQLAFGGNQGIATIQCTDPITGGSNNGNTTLTDTFIKGCGDYFTTTTTDTCTGTGSSASPYTCVNTNNGAAKSSDVDNGMDARINNASGSCVHPNYWKLPNTVDDLEKATPTDPRLVTLMITDYSDGLGNGSGKSHPIVHFAEFYVTGYYGDPCATAANLPGTSPSNLTAYTTDDAVTTSGVILGHFISQVAPPSNVQTNGTCQLNSFDQCVEVITR